MLVHRRSESLDTADLGWLKARYHFQVRAAGNPAHHPLGPLVVWNDDEIAPSSGFPLHAHRDTEIITYVRQGVLAHRDTLGSEGLINTGDIQVMSAGTGIRHAEFNAGQTPLKVYQIWFKPRETGLEPRWRTKSFTAGFTDRFEVLASGFADESEALPIHADARLLRAKLKAGERLSKPLDNPFSYLVVASGRISVDGELMRASDGLAITNADALDIAVLEHSELVMVETG